MYITELIQQLNNLLAQHGDLPVVDEDDNELYPPEFNEDTPQARAVVLSFDD